MENRRVVSGEVGFRYVNVLRGGGNEFGGEEKYRVRMVVGK
ncbi:hypothetical protein [Siminovitchia fortis]|nr:hypothetical protein [Siminovitchia fortis]